MGAHVAAANDRLGCRALRRVAFAADALAAVVADHGPAALGTSLQRHLGDACVAEVGVFVLARCCSAAPLVPPAHEAHIPRAVGPRNTQHCCLQAVQAGT